MEILPFIHKMTSVWKSKNMDYYDSTPIDSNNPYSKDINSFSEIMILQENKHYSVKNFKPILNEDIREWLINNNISYAIRLISINKHANPFRIQTVNGWVTGISNYGICFEDVDTKVYFKMAWV